MKTKTLTMDEIEQIGVAEPQTKKLSRDEIEQIGIQEMGGEKPITAPSVGIAETALQMGTGALLEPVAGLYGMGAAAMPGGKTGVEAIEDVMGFAYQPKTLIGKRISEAVAQPFKELDDQIDFISEKAGVGNPILQAMIKTSIYGIPAVAGVRGVRGTKTPSGAIGASVTRSQAKRAKAAIEKSAEDLGVDLGSWDMADQIIRQAEDVAPSGRGSAIEGLQTEVQRRAEADRAAAREIYAEAEEMGASVNETALSGFYDRVAIQLKDDDIPMMPSVRRRLQELEELKDPQGESWVNPDGSVDINQIERYRKRLNKKTSDPDEGRVLGKIKKEVDKKLNEIYDQDMMSGSTDAIQKWKEAREAWHTYKDKYFKQGSGANKVIRDLVQKDANVDEFRNWIFGTNALGGKKISADVVKRVKGILGEDSPQIRGLRSEVLYDIVEPIIREQPNFRQFVRNYDKLMRENRSLVKELEPMKMSDLKALRDIAAAAEKTGRKERYIPDVTNLIARSGPWAHGIAKAGMRQQIVRGLIKTMINTEGAAKKRIIHEMLGYKPNMPLIPTGTMAYTAVIADQISQQDKKNEKFLFDEKPQGVDVGPVTFNRSP